MLESESLVCWTGNVFHFIRIASIWKQIIKFIYFLFRNIDPNAGFWNAGPSLSPNLTPQSFQNQPNFNPGYQVKKINFFKIESVENWAVLDESHKEMF
jgi:hypothetical protein